MPQATPPPDGYRPPPREPDVVIVQQLSSEEMKGRSQSEWTTHVAELQQRTEEAADALRSDLDKRAETERQLDQGTKARGTTRTSQQVDPKTGENITPAKKQAKAKGEAKGKGKGKERDR